ncbi:MAG TPA: YCF48-related protein [Pyrinomonadaceae bacterium]|nr:YCF48-related protein [Pyrinomonadaceae bacterium]
MLYTKKIRASVSIFLSVAILQATVGIAASAETDETAASAYADWQLLGPEGGDVRVVAVDPRDKDRLYMSTLDGHIHTSVDGGRSWRLLVNLNKPGLVLDQLFVDARDSRTIYASGQRHKGPGGFYRSTDGGATWKESKELRNESIHAMTQSTHDPEILLAGTVNGVWRSTNSGADWEKISSSSMPVNIDALAMDPRNTSTIYAGTWWRAYKTTDAGKSWRLIKDGMIDDSDVFAVTVDPRNPDHIVASACSGIYESQNGGEKWSKINGIPSQSRRTRDILQHPSVPGTIYAGTTEGFWMSSNGGKTWALTTQRNLEINSIAVHPDAPERVFIGTNNHGVMVSNDGGKNFTETNGNFTSRLTYSITPDRQQQNRLYAATHNTSHGGGFFFISDDSGRTWQKARNLDVNRVRVFAVRQDDADPNQMLLGTNVGIFRSTDRGVSWTQLVVPKPVKKPAAKKPVSRKGKKSAVAVAKTIEPAPTGPVLIPAISDKVKVLESDGKGGLLAGTDNGLYRTSDLTKGWEKVAIGEHLNQNIFAVHVSPGRPDTIWAGTATSGVIVSRDSGNTWERAGGAVDNIPVSSIASDPKRPDTVYVGTIQTFYVTRDSGKTWVRRGGNLPLGNYTTILINPDNSDEIIISSSFENSISSSFDNDGGIYISTDAGNRWKRVDTKEMRLPSRRVWSMAFDPQDPTRIFAGTHSSGIYKIERTARTSAGM